MAKDTQKTIEGTIGAFKQLKQEVEQLKNELTDLTKQGKGGTEEWTKKAKELANAQKQVDAVTKAAKGNLAAYNVEEAKTINDLKELIKLKNQERNSMDMSSKEYKKATEELKVLNDKLREAGTSAGDWKANVGNYANSIRDAFGDLSTAAGGLTGSIGGLNAGMLKLATNPVGATVVALATAIKVLADGIKSSEANTQKWNEAMIPLKTVFVMLENAVQKVAGQFAEFVKKLGESERTGKVVKGVLEGIITAFNIAKTSISNIIGATKQGFDKIKEFVGKLKEWAGGLKQTFEPVVTFVGKVTDALKKSLQPVIEWIIDAYNDLADTWLGRQFGLVTIQQLKKIEEQSKATTDALVEEFKETKEEVDDATEATNKLNGALNSLMKAQAAQEGVVSQANLKYTEALNNEKLTLEDLQAAQEALNQKKEAEIKLAKLGVAVAAAQRDEIAKNAKLTQNSAEANRALAQAEAEVIRAQNGVKDAEARANQEQIKLNKKIEQYNEETRKSNYQKSVEELQVALNKYNQAYNDFVNNIQAPNMGELINPDTIKSYYDQVIINAQAEYEAYVDMQNAKIAALEEFVKLESEKGNDVTKQEIELAKLREEAAGGYTKAYKKMNDTITKSDQDRLKQQKAFQKSQLKGYADLFDAVGQLFEEDTIAYKATATAKAIVSTYLAANEALAAGGGVPWGLIPMAATITAGLANVYSIWKTGSKETTVPSAGSSTPSVVEPVMQETQPFTYTRTAQTFEEEQQLNQPIWVSVQEINSVQNRVKVTENESTY